MMHTYWDTLTRDNTLALYGVRPSRVQTLIRTIARFFA